MIPAGSRVVIKRVYEPVSPDDGFRVLVDRLWPRGVSRERAALDLWLKEVAPSTELRVWFDHQDERFAEFTRRYRAELDANPAVDLLRETIAEHPLTTLLFGAKSLTMNEAAVLADYLAEPA
jgi:DNA-3-methyladenine glycosylase